MIFRCNQLITPTLSIVSRHSAAGSEPATIAPPQPIVTLRGVTTAVRIATARSAAPLSASHPIPPAYTPRGAPSSSTSQIAIVRRFGAPVIDPGGNAARR